MNKPMPKHSIKELEAQIRTLKSQLTKESLTNLLNRRGFNEQILPILDEVNWHLENPKNPRQSIEIRSLSLLVMDLDNFKKINDVYGHSVGDKVLAKVAQVIRSRTRSIDISARWGGEEFVIGLVGTNLEQAAKVAEDLRRTIAATYVTYRTKKIRVTISVGVATLTKKMKFDSLFQNADHALLQAKRAGRNRVVANP